MSKVPTIGWQREGFAKEMSKASAYWKKVVREEEEKCRVSGKIKFNWQKHWHPDCLETSLKDIYDISEFEQIKNQLNPALVAGWNNHARSDQHASARAGGQGRVRGNNSGENSAAGRPPASFGGYRRDTGPPAVSGSRIRPNGEINEKDNVKRIRTK